MPKYTGCAQQADTVAALTAYTAHATGAAVVVSASAGDLNTTAAQVAENTVAINAILTALKAAGIMAK